MTFADADEEGNLFARDEDNGGNSITLQWSHVAALKTIKMTIW